MASALAAVMALSTAPYAMAEETVYSYIKDGETVNVTQADLAAGNWNPAYMSHMPIEQYADFPMMLDKNVTGKAELNVLCTYLKNVTENDEVTFSVIDRDSGEVFLTQAITAENTFIEVENLPINKTYNFVIRENEKTSTAVIQTYYKKAEMPKNILLYDDEEESNIGAEAQEVRVKDMTLGTTLIEKEDGTFDVDKHAVTMAPEELPAYFEDINDDHIYSVQSNADGDIFMGYLSKSMEYNCDYIFTPTYKYNLEKDFNKTPIKRVPEKNKVIIDMLKQLADNPTDVTHLCDYYINVPKGINNAKVYRLMTEKVGEYVVKGFSDNDMTVYYGIAEYTDGHDIPTAWNKRMNPENGIHVGMADNYYLYIICYTDYNSSNAVLSFSLSDSNDSAINSVYEADLQNTPASLNTELSGKIDYSGDTDVYMINNTSAGNYSIILNNLGIYSLQTKVFTKSGDYYYYYDDYPVRIAGRTRATTSDYNFAAMSTERLFVAVQAQKSDVNNIDYQINILSPDCPDPYEPNNNEIQAKDLSLLTSPIKDATLSLGDRDYYKFTVGESGAVLSIGANSSCKEIQAITVYGQNTDFSITGSLERNETMSRILNAELPGNETYIVTVLKKTNSGYCPGHTYTLSWSITENQ